VAGAVGARSDCSGDLIDSHMAVGAALGLNNPCIAGTWRILHHSAIIREIPPRSVRTVGSHDRLHLPATLNCAFAIRLTPTTPRPVSRNTSFPTANARMGRIVRFTAYLLSCERAPPRGNTRGPPQ